MPILPPFASHGFGERVGQSGAVGVVASADVDRLALGAAQALLHEIGQRRALESVGRRRAVDEAVVLEVGDLVGGGGRRDLQHALADRDRSRDRDRAGRRRIPARDAGRVVRVHDLAGRLHGGLRVGLVVLVDDLDGVVDAGFLDRRIDLIKRHFRGLAARRPVVRQVSGQRHDVADRQIECLLAAASAVVATGGQSDRCGEHETRDQERHDSCLPQSPSSLTVVT